MGGGVIFMRVFLNVTFVNVLHHCLVKVQSFVFAVMSIVELETTDQEMVTTGSTRRTDIGTLYQSITKSTFSIPNNGS